MKEDIQALKTRHEIEKRRLALKLLSEGLTQSKVGELFGVTRKTINRWYRQYQQEGESALAPLPRGRSRGNGRYLSSQEESQLIHTMMHHRPNQLGIPYALWTRRAVAELIRHTLTYDMPIRTVGSYLTYWGMTPKKPIKRLDEHSSQVVREWQENDYPVIHARAKHEHAEIYWADETSVHSDGQQDDIPTKHIPVIDQINMMSATTNQGTVRFHLHKGTLDAQQCIVFLKHLTQDANRKVFLIVDSLKAHHDKRVKSWIKENNTTIELFYIPPYSGELSSAEYPNNDLHNAVQGVLPDHTLQQLKANVWKRMY